jgi:Uma2 family endonuclease
MSTASLPAPKRPKEYKIRFDEYGAIKLPSGAEFVDGKIVFKRRNRGSAMSEVSNWVGFQLARKLADYLDAHPVGVVFRGAEDFGYQCFPDDPKQIRKPDVSFVRRDVTKSFLRGQGWTPDVPELIVEVLSPEDKFNSIETRIDDFLSAGTKLVWLIDPKLERAEVIHPDRVKYPVAKTGILNGEDVLPGFQLPLASILPPK